MLNLVELEKESFIFMDGDKKIVTNDPTQELYELALTIDAEQMVGKIDEMFYNILAEKDKHYAEELNIRIKVLIFTDYLRFHTEQLASKFPSTSNSGV